MALGIRGQASNNGLGNADVTVTLPVGTTTGDVVFSAYSEADTADRNAAMVTTGYTELADLYSNDNNDTNLGVFRKVQGGTPDTTAVFDSLSGDSGRGVACTTIVLTGVDTTTPEDATPSPDGANINSAVVDAPSVTTVTNNAMVLAIGANSTSNTNHSDVITAPTNYINLETELGNGSGRDAWIMLATRIKTPAGAEDPGVFGGITTSTNDSWCAASIAVRPAAAAAVARSRGYIMG